MPLPPRQDPLAKGSKLVGSAPGRQILTLMRANRFVFERIRLPWKHRQILGSLSAADVARNLIFSIELRRDTFRRTPASAEARRGAECSENEASGGVIRIN